MEKDNVLSSFTFSEFCFLLANRTNFVTTHANFSYLVDKVKTYTRDANDLFKKNIVFYCCQDKTMRQGRCYQPYKVKR